MKDEDTIKLTITSTGLKLDQLGQLHIRTSGGLLKRIDFEMNPGDQIVKISVPADIFTSGMTVNVGLFGPPKKD